MLWGGFLIRGLQVCAESVCVKHMLEQCDCPGDSKKQKCHLCCQQPGNLIAQCTFVLQKSVYIPTLSRYVRLCQFA